MAITALAGPLMVGWPTPQGPSGTMGGSANENPEYGPSLFVVGAGLMDLRPQFSYKPGQDMGSLTYGWIDSSQILVVNQVPSTLAANNIALSQVPVAGTALTLTAGTGVTGSTSITNALTGATVTGLLALDGAMGSVSYGQSATVNIWDPTKAVSRAVRVVSSGDDTSAFFTIAGFDVYGFPMTQKLTGANGTATTTKAFKYIQSVTPSGTLSGSAVTVGTTDVFGLPMRSDVYYTGGAGVDITLYWNGGLITATTGYVAAVTTTASATTGDVRGTYNVQSASDAAKRLVVYASPSLANLATATGQTGVAQA